MKTIDLDYLCNKEDANIFIQLNDIDDLYVEIEGVPEGKLSSSRVELQQCEMFSFEDINTLIFKDSKDRDYREKVIVKFYLTEELAQKLSFDIRSYYLKMKNITLKGMNLEDYMELDCDGVNFIEKATLKSLSHRSIPIRAIIENSSNLSLKGPISTCFISKSRINKLEGVFGETNIEHSFIKYIYNVDSAYSSRNIDDYLYFLELSLYHENYRTMNINSSYVDDIYFNREKYPYNLECVSSKIDSITLQSTFLKLDDCHLSDYISSDRSIVMNDCDIKDWAGKRKMFIESADSITVSVKADRHRVKQRRKEISIYAKDYHKCLAKVIPYKKMY